MSKIRSYACVVMRVFALCIPTSTVFIFLYLLFVCLFVSIVIIIISIQLSPPLLFIYFEWNKEEKKTHNIYSSFLFYIFIAVCFICGCQLVIKTRRDNKIPYSCVYICVSWVAVKALNLVWSCMHAHQKSAKEQKNIHLAMVWRMRANFNWFFSDHNAHICPFY